MFLCRQKRFHVVFCGIFFIGMLVIVDQVIKWLVLQSQTLDVLCNFGIAMGITLPRMVFFVLWGVIMIGVLYFWTKKMRERFFVQIPYILILSGGISNLIDRFSYGCIVDYIPLWTISSFNIADAMITCGAFLILWQNFRKKNKTRY